MRNVQMFTSKPLLRDTKLWEAHTYKDHSDGKPPSWVESLFRRHFRMISFTVGSFSLSGTEEQVQQLDRYFTCLLSGCAGGKSATCCCCWRGKLLWNLLCWMFACGAKVGKIFVWIGPVAATAASSTEQKEKTRAELSVKRRGMCWGSAGGLVF